MNNTTSMTMTIQAISPGLITANCFLFTKSPTFSSQHLALEQNYACTGVVLTYYCVTIHVIQIATTVGGTCTFL